MGRPESNDRAVFGAIAALLRTKLAGALSRCATGECTILAHVARVQTRRVRQAKGGVSR